MTDTVRYPLVLGLISLCSSAALALSYCITRDEIRRQEKLQKDRGLAAVLGVTLDEQAAERPWKELAPPAAEGAEPAFLIYAATDPATGRALYAAEGSARGYSSKITIVLAVDQSVTDKPDAARIKAVKVVGQAETPGLGSQCQTPEFQEQFHDLLLGKLELKKGAAYHTPGHDDQPIAAITGATITSEAVVAAARQALDRIRQGAEQPPRPEAPVERP